MTNLETINQIIDNHQILLKLMQFQSRLIESLASEHLQAEHDITQLTVKRRGRPAIVKETIAKPKALKKATVTEEEKLNRHLAMKKRWEVARQEGRNAL